MTDQTPPPIDPPSDPTAPQPPPPAYGAPAPGQVPPPPPYGAVPVNPYGAPPVAYGAPGYGQIGKVRSTGTSILLFIVTLGIYGYVWWWKTHDEMKNHTGQGLGGPIAFIIAFLISPVAAFLTSDEVGKLYERRGQAKPVSAITGLWYFPGMLLLVLPIVWFVKTNGALNDYWKSLGAQG
ncbi:DUF4234 domain-containing protein [Nocardioides marmoriginsengisoli]|uniref:DUF4234 domain-containing protein n=1 Tax=Nocardioides marmoriginsengisoli TaxID=661483 RepID=A0A3N0CPF9_9ACTN|nr:DUF4234 domain-containing protein [Nocardioides marmoriginsengisoli]RNL65352.1 DUF4234 domain-containing protein [Nocardioides marmoriginsengisoli]